MPTDKKRPTPPGCDYEPVCGEHEHISFGTIEAGREGKWKRLEDVIGRRWFPTERPTNFAETWPAPTAHKPEVLLNKGASDHLEDVRALCAAYHSKADGEIRHLASNVTIRFPGVDVVPQELRLHEARELSRGFGLRLADALSTAVVFCMHIPARSWGVGHPHAHLLIPCRILLPGSGFGRFIPDLTDPLRGRELIDGAWRIWTEENGHAL